MKQSTWREEDVLLVMAKAEVLSVTSTSNSGISLFTSTVTLFFLFPTAIRSRYEALWRGLELQNRYRVVVIQWRRIHFYLQSNLRKRWRRILKKSRNPLCRWWWFVHNFWEEKINPFHCLFSPLYRVCDRFWCCVLITIHVVYYVSVSV